MIDIKELEKILGVVLCPHCGKSTNKIISQLNDKKTVYKCDNCLGEFIIDKDNNAHKV